MATILNNEINLMCKPLPAVPRRRSISKWMICAPIMTVIIKTSIVLAIRRYEIISLFGLIGVTPVSSRNVEKPVKVPSTTKLNAAHAESPRSLLVIIRSVGFNMTRVCPILWHKFNSHSGILVT